MKGKVLTAYDYGLHAGKTDFALSKPEKYQRFDGTLVECTDTGFIPVPEDQRLYAIAYLAGYWETPSANGKS